MKKSLSHFEWFVFWVVLSICIGIFSLSWMESQYAEKKIQQMMIGK